jgi:DNA primase
MILNKDQLLSIVPNSKLSSNGKNIKTNCPECGQNEFYISLTKPYNPGQCWRKVKCGYKCNIYSLLKHYDLLREFLKERYGGKYSEKIESFLESTVKEELNLEIDECILPLGYKKLESHEYITERGFNDNLGIEFGITKINPKFKNYVIFPIRQNCEIVAYVSRSIFNKDFCEQNQILRYKNSESSFEKILFGIDDVEKGDVVIIVEGLFDKFAIDRFLKKNNLSAKCCCTFGAHFSTYHIFMLLSKNVENVAIMYDPDAIKMIKRTLSDVEYLFKDVVVAWGLKGDPDESSDEEILDSLLKAKNSTAFQYEILESKLK